jgi:hypothetical protein
MRTWNKSASVKLAALAGLAISCQSAMAQTVFYSQDFESTTLTDQSSDPTIVTACGAQPVRFTHNPPAGWTWNTCDTKTYACRVPGCVPAPSACGPCGTTEGVREWEGWSFVQKDWWAQVAGDQNRTQFTLGTGNVAVADPDEWDDRGDPDTNCGFLNTFMGTPAISLAGTTPGTLAFTFDSSWRPEGFDDANFQNNQTAIINAYYTVGGIELPAVEVLRWDSDPSGAFFKADATNETVTLDNARLQAPANATAVRFEFGLVEAANDWWWAMDNLALTADFGGTPTTIFSEGFETVVLEPAFHEVPPACGTAYCNTNVYTHTAPGGMTITNTANTTGGIADWRGWSVTTIPFWSCAAGTGAGREAFGNATGKVAVADSDRFDDLQPYGGEMGSLLATPAINISSRSGNLIVLSFDSNWRRSGNQTATITARFDNGAPVQVLRWESAAGPNQKATANNERVALAIAVPAAATTMTLDFDYIGDDNWYWAIDNISVFEGEATINLASNLSPNTAVMTLAPSVNFAPCTAPWSPDMPAGWTDVFAPLGACSPCGRPEWAGWSVGWREWWGSPRVDTQLRETFVLGTGYVAIADPDEWDDQENGQSNFNAFATTPSIALPPVPSNLQLSFASSWRDEAFDDNSSSDPNPPAATIDTISTGATAVVTTTAPHGLVSGNYVTIAGNNSVPQLGRVRITVTSPTTFEVPGANVTTAGTGGTALRRNTNNQTAVIKAIYTVGGVEQPGVEVLRWDSDSGRTAGPTQIFVPASPFFKNDAPNETVTIPQADLAVPAGAQSVKFEFALVNARNDWWWAVDNISLDGNGNNLFTEDFETVVNGQTPPTELAPLNACFYYSTVAAQNVSLEADNTSLANCSGTSDFEGFTSWLTNAWALGAGGGLRTQFGAPTAFVSDFAASGCDGVARLFTPNYSIAAINPDSINISFRSGWLNAAGHTSRIDVSYDNGSTWNNVLLWEPSNKATATDELVTVPVNNPAGATQMKVRFSDAESGWWALSNISITGTVGTPVFPCNYDFNQDENVDLLDAQQMAQVFVGLLTPEANWLDGDLNGDENADLTDAQILASFVVTGVCNL